jgi:hypothetical protein
MSSSTTGEHPRHVGGDYRTNGNGGDYQTIGNRR